MNATAEKSTSVRQDVVVFLLAAVCFFVLSGLGAVLLSRSFLSGGPFIGEEGIAAAYWLQWGGKIIGRFAGDYLCGFLLGRYLRRIKPWHLVIVFSLFPIGLLVVNRGFFEAHDGYWLQTIGPVSAAFQKGMQIAFIIIMMCWGVWHGQRTFSPSQKSAENYQVFFRIGTVLFYMAASVPCFYAVFMLSYAARFSSFDLFVLGVNSTLMGFAMFSGARFCQTKRRLWLVIGFTLTVLCLGHVVLFAGSS